MSFHHLFVRSTLASGSLHSSICCFAASTQETAVSRWVWELQGIIGRLASRWFEADVVSTSTEPNVRVETRRKGVLSLRELLASAVNPAFQAELLGTVRKALRVRCIFADLDGSASQE